jgi:hypothetical protein
MLKTRAIKLRLDGQEPTSYLMPMLDLVNHHPGAPAYRHDGDSLCIGTWRSSEYGECFVSYGSTRDALGIALAYGYVDPNITRVNALPDELPMPRGGTLRLQRASHPDFTQEPDVLTIIGASFDAADARVEQETLIDPIERHLRDRGAPAMQARHQARVLSRRIAGGDLARLSEAERALSGVDGCELVVRAVHTQQGVLRSTM